MSGLISLIHSILEQPGVNKDLKKLMFIYSSPPSQTCSWVESNFYAKLESLTFILNVIFKLLTFIRNIY